MSCNFCIFSKLINSDSEDSRFLSLTKMNFRSVKMKMFPASETFPRNFGDTGGRNRVVWRSVVAPFVVVPAVQPLFGNEEIKRRSANEHRRLDPFSFSARQTKIKINRPLSLSLSLFLSPPPSSFSLVLSVRQPFNETRVAVVCALRACVGCFARIIVLLCSARSLSRVTRPSQPYLHWNCLINAR